MVARFDLITIDVVDPRSTAAVLMDRGSFEIELDEDDGRWLVVSSSTDARRFGLQRSDEREVAARSGGIDDVIDGHLMVHTSTPAETLEFFRSALTLDDPSVIDVVGGNPGLSNLHLDFVCEVAEFDTEVDRLVDLGAVRIGPHRSAHWGENQIFTAPGGQLFCLNAYPSDATQER